MARISDILSADPRLLLSELEEELGAGEVLSEAEGLIEERRAARLAVGESRDLEEKRAGSTDLEQSWSATRPEIDLIIQQALEGTLPLTRNLHYWEPTKLNPRHIEIIFMRASGLKQKRIAEILDVKDSMVSICLRHPFARYLLTKILSYAADEIIDVETRMKAYAPECLDTIMEIVRDPTASKALRSKNAFGILASTGHGKENKLRITQEFKVPTDRMSLLTAALDEANKIPEIEYAVLGENEGLDVAASGAGMPPTGSPQSSIGLLREIQAESEEDFLAEEVA